MSDDSTARQIHNVPPDEVFGLLGSRPAGLTADEVARRLREIGPNTLETTGHFRWGRMLLKHFTNFFSVLLYVSAGLCLLAEKVQPGESMALLGAALFGVAILNGVFAFAQEYRAERAMEELRKFLPQRVTVRRDGAERDVLADELVPGDIVLIGEGTKLAADARLVECQDLLVNNAPLTGESRALPLTTDAAAGRLGDSPNVVFAGCAVMRGNGAAVVFATGRRSEFGKIASLSQNIERPPSPLEREVTRMARILTVIAVTMGLTFFLYGVVTGRPLLVNLVFMMGIIVANVPEGLLPTLTLALSMGSLRMARKNVLVKNLEAVESLGAMHVVCTDKTGTLTKNELAIARIVDPIRGAEWTDTGPRREALKLALIASEVHRRGGELTGDPLDIAVTELYAQRHGDVGEVLSHVVKRFPFDVQKRSAAGLLVMDIEGLFAIKGAWESLRPHVRAMIDPQYPGESPVNEERLSQADAVVHRLASQGYRVIAIAYRKLPAASPPDTKAETLSDQLVLQSFLALEDPIRPEVPAAMQSCHRAGIRVVLITGDHPDTASAVARRIGMLLHTESSEDASALVVRGDELEQMRERALIEKLKSGVNIFARTTPEQKMKIVNALKQLGLVVGMTGDGVNDAPALKAADVGIAMGVGGTDVAREAADIILLDNNFASIIAGVEEGRTIFRNIRRFTDYVLASNVPEIVPYLLYIVLPVPLALTIIQILAIDLGTDIIPAIGLGQEPPEPDTMQQPPRRVNEGLLTWPLLSHAYLFFGVIEAAYSLLLFFYVLIAVGWRFGDPPLAGSDPLYRSATAITLASIVLMQIGNLIGRRSLRHSGLDRSVFRNHLIVLGVTLEVLFAWAILYFEPVQQILGTGPVSPTVFALAWLGAPLVFGIDYLRKRIAYSPTRTA